MRLFEFKQTFDFMGRRRPAAILSAVLLIISVGSFFVRGFNLGIDFTGGTLIEVGYPEPVSLENVRPILAEAGFENAIVQHFGTTKDVLIRLAPKSSAERETIGDRVFAALKQASGNQLELKRVEFVGPQVGEELREKGGLAMLYALIGILIYVALRFEYRFSVGAIAALVHDVLITLGFFSLFGVRFDLTVLAALLAVIGYSLNDTIVVYDRIRENFRKIRKGSPASVINTSINETLSRTLMTSLTTLLVLFALLFLGGEAINAFALALIVGVFIGTYSSIFVASTTTLALGVSKTDLMPVKKEGEEDYRP